MHSVNFKPFKTSHALAPQITGNRFASVEKNYDKTVKQQRSLLFSYLSTVGALSFAMFAVLNGCFVNSPIKSALKSFQSTLKKESSFASNVGFKSDGGASAKSDSEFLSLIATLKKDLIRGNVAAIDPELRNLNPLFKEEHNTLFNNLKEETTKINKPSKLAPVFDRYLNEVFIPCIKPYLDDSNYNEETVKRFADKCRFDAYNYFNGLSNRENLQTAFVLACAACVIAAGTTFYISKKND